VSELAEHRPARNETAPSRLAALRGQLADLRRRRRRICLGTAYIGLGLIVLCGLAVIFPLDWWLVMSRLQRAICLAAAGGVGYWAFRRTCRPWLLRRESELDVALLVEGLEQIDSDLIAAVQFDSPDAAGWGSAQLERAVIERAAALGPGLDVGQAISYRRLSRRARLLAATLLLWTGVTLWVPGHVAAFLCRLAFSSRPYPTMTRIDAIAVKSHAIDPGAPDAPIAWDSVPSRPADPGGEPLKIPFGHRARIEVQSSGRLPDGGRADLTVMRDGRSAEGRTVKLGRVDQGNVYVAELDRLVDETHYRLSLGDAQTDVGVLSVIALPQAEIELEVVPPGYVAAAAPAESPEIPPGLRQVSVVEGSRVVIRLRSDRPLEAADVSLQQPDAATSTEAHFAMRPAPPDGQNAAGTCWVLDADDTPLAAVRRTVKFSVDVTDPFGQHLSEPIEGRIDIQGDERPSVAGAIVTPYVLPNAEPSIAFRATDDYGLARVAIEYEVIHEGGLPEPEQEITIWTPPEVRPTERHAVSPTLDTGPGRQFAFDLRPLGLVKGDRVRVTLKAVDSRGAGSGKAGLGDEPLLFRVTDERGIRAMIAAEDLQSARELDKMIRWQLGIGGSR